MSKIIDLDVYNLGNGLYFMSYTAKWCGPCKRIKPSISSFVNDKIFSTEIDQPEFQTKINKYVPFFIISKDYQNPNNFNLIDKIQTSNVEEFSSFMKKHALMNIDENF